MNVDINYDLIKKAHIVGASLGGMISQEMTLNYPDRVLTLTILMSTPGFDTPGLSGPTESFKQSIKKSFLFPKFEDLARRYIEEISVLKKCYNDERSKILQFIKETWAVYPINRILPHTINKWKDTALKTQSGGSVNRKLDVISSMYTTFKREWGYPVENPVLQIRRPKRAAPRDRRLSDAEIKKLLRGNRTSPIMKSIIQISLETGMRLSEILRAERKYIDGSTLNIPITKTKPRIIPLTNKALKLLKDAELPFKISKWQVSKQFRKLCDGYGIKNAVFL